MIFIKGSKTKTKLKQIQLKMQPAQDWIETFRKSGHIYWMAQERTQYETRVLTRNTREVQEETERNKFQQLRKKLEMGY